MIVGKYEIKKKLGDGSYGEVVLAKDQNSQIVAIKAINKENLDSKGVEHLTN